MQGTEDDVLLLDISNNDEYIWTTNFVLQPASPSSVPSSSSLVPSSSVSTSPVTVTVQPNTGVIVGAVIGSVFGGILLTIGSFLFYKRYKNNREQNMIAIPTPGNSNYSNRTIGSFLFCKRYKNNREQNIAIPTPGNSNYSN